jgi:hypothetical protein
MRKEMNKDNYRGVGLSKEECQKKVDAVIETFKKENPGKEVPKALLTWVDNIADDVDVAVAKARMQARKDGLPVPSAKEVIATLKK